MMSRLKSVEGLLNDFRGAAQCPVDGSWCAQRCQLRRSGCCDGAAQTSSVALILRVAFTTELMLLRRS